MGVGEGVGVAVGVGIVVDVAVGVGINVGIITVLDVWQEEQVTISIHKMNKERYLILFITIFSVFKRYASTLLCVGILCKSNYSSSFRI